jgi:hypothetical protein
MLARAGGAALVVLVWLGFAGGLAEAGIEIVSESAAVDRDAGTVRFTLEFSGTPGFWTVDEFGRVADSFQYEIDGDWKAPIGLLPEGLDAVVRGDEIRVADALRIRDATFGVDPDPDPDAGGWGAVRAEVPFRLEDNELTFEAPLGTIGDEGDGFFAYRVFTTEFGLTLSSIESRLLPPGEEPTPGPVPIPLPGALPAVAVAALLLGGGSLSRSLVRRAMPRPR